MISLQSRVEGAIAAALIGSGTTDEVSQTYQKYSDQFLASLLKVYADSIGLGGLYSFKGTDEKAQLDLGSPEALATVGSAVLEVIARTSIQRHTVVKVLDESALTYPWLVRNDDAAAEVNKFFEWKMPAKLMAAVLDCMGHVAEPYLFLTRGRSCSAYKPANSFDTRWFKYAMPAAELVRLLVVIHKAATSSVLSKAIADFRSKNEDSYCDNPGYYWLPGSCRLEACLQIASENTPAIRSEFIWLSTMYSENVRSSVLVAAMCSLLDGSADSIKQAVEYLEGR